MKKKLKESILFGVIGMFVGALITLLSSYLVFIPIGFICAFVVPLFFPSK